MRKGFTALIFFLCFHFGYSQLFGNEKHMALVRKGVDHIYGIQPDSARLYIEKVEQALPGHPAASMMRALNVLWTNIPVVTVDTVFKAFSGHLQETIRRSARLDGGRQENPEAIFFEMSARGLLAEYYADGGQYMKALNEAGQAYYLVKAGFKLSEEIPEFLLTTGVYNYFREKYPEKHPVYKPLLWFFKSGDIDLGISQIKAATKKAVLTRVEAHVYLAYIYLRYEDEPRKAQTYLSELNRIYPHNPYIQVKYLESLTPGEDFRRASLAMIKGLAASDRPYYQMAGEVFWGLYEEKAANNTSEAIRHYRLSMAAGSVIPEHGEYYRSLAYLGLGRIYVGADKKDQAIYNLKKCLVYAETEDIRSEANQLLEEVE